MRDEALLPEAPAAVVELLAELFDCATACVRAASRLEKSVRPGDDCPELPLPESAV